MEVCFGIPADIDHWMNLVRRVSWNFPGLETEEALEEHRQIKMKMSGSTQKNAVLIFSLLKWTGVLRSPDSFWKDKAPAGDLENRF